MSRLDPAGDQVQQQLDERRALLATVTGERAAKVREQIAVLEARQLAPTTRASQ